LKEDTPKDPQIINGKGLLGVSKETLRSSHHLSSDWNYDMMMKDTMKSYDDIRRFIDHETEKRYHLDMSLIASRHWEDDDRGLLHRCYHSEGFIMIHHLNLYCARDCWLKKIICISPLSW
jgi:hypothetical protein